MAELEFSLARSRASPMSLGRALRTEVWDHLPVWLFLFYGWALLNAFLTNLSPPRPDLAFTAAFPLAVFAAYYSLRAMRAEDVRRRRLMLVGIPLLVIVLPVTTLLWHRPYPIESRRLRDIYEFTNFLWVGLAVFHAARTNWTRATIFFGAALFYGALLENGGILLGYFHETRLRTKLPPLVAPVATMIGWSLVIYMAFFVVIGMRRWIPSLKTSALASGFCVALVATLLDIELDPLATSVGCWEWDPSLPPVLGPVPLVNFIAWLSALVPYGWAYFTYQERAGIEDHAPWPTRHLVIATAGAPVVLCLAAVVFLTLITLAEGIHGPSWGVLLRGLAPLERAVAVAGG
jgi:hypothetical protein